MRWKSVMMLCIVMAAMLQAPAANADPDYTSTYQTVSSATVVNPNCTPGTVDISSSWVSTINNTADWDSYDRQYELSAIQDITNNFKTAVNEGSIAVSEYYSPDGTQNVHVAFNTYANDGLVYFPNVNEVIFGASGSGAQMYNLDISLDGNGAYCKVVVHPTGGDVYGISHSNLGISTSAGDQKTFSVSGTFTVQYPDPYNGTQVVPGTPVNQYVAMGDSFSSGQGNSPYEPGTNDSGGPNDGCHRSPQAYPRLLESFSRVGVPADFVACAGSVTDNVRFGATNNTYDSQTIPGYTNYTEDPQVSALSANTKIVSITVGGDDVGFQTYAHSCIVPSTCGTNSSSYQAIINNIESSQFKANLVATYDLILHSAQNANVYVLDYPYLAPETVNTGCPPLGVVDLSTTYSVELTLNEVIASAISQEQSNDPADAARLNYVPTNGSNSPFAGKDLCSTSPDFYQATPYDLSRSFHPNTLGQQDYATVLEQYISSH